jgi:hypothetical protein
VIYTWIFLIISIVFAGLAVFSHKFLGFSSEIINSYQSMFSSFFVALLGASFANYWNYKNRQQQEEISRGSLSLSVAPENVISITNHGKTAIKILSVSSIMNDYPRSWGTQKRLISEFNKNKDSVVEDVAHRNIDLNSDESIILTLGQTGIDKGIEEYEFIMQIIKIEYKTYMGKQYKKYFGVGRLTSPISWIMYRLSHLNDVNINAAISKLNMQGKFYIDNLIPDFLYQEAKNKPIDVNIFPTDNSIKETIKSYEQYLKMIQIKTDVPQNQWFIFRSEEISK